MKGLLIHFRPPPEPLFWSLFGEIRCELDRLYWCFDNQPWFGAPADFDDSALVWLSTDSISSVMLWSPGNLSRYADRFCEEHIRLWGIDSEKNDPVDFAESFSGDFRTSMGCSTVFLNYTDSTCWEIYADDDLLERLSRSLSTSAFVLHDMEWKHRDRDFQAALGYSPYG